MNPVVSLSLPVGLAIAVLLSPAGSAAGGLYQCVTNGAAPIYTDTPAQLEHCTPIPASGAVTSLATVSSGHPPTGSVPDLPTMTPVPTQQTAELPASDLTPSTLAPVPLSTTAAPLPCPVGINPLNPFSHPLCSDPDVPTPADQSIPPDSAAQPAPYQPFRNQGIRFGD